MKLDELLELLRERRLAIHVGPSGETSLKGDKADATGPLLRELSRHKAEVLKRFGPPAAPKPKLTRRLVLVKDGREIVLREMSPAEAMGSFWAEQLARPGDDIRLQTLESTRGYERWVTYTRTLQPDQLEVD